MENAELIDRELERIALGIGIPPCPSILLLLAAEAKKPVQSRGTGFTRCRIVSSAAQDRKFTDLQFEQQDRYSQAGNRPARTADAHAHRVDIDCETGFFYQGFHQYGTLLGFIQQACHGRIAHRQAGAWNQRGTGVHLRLVPELRNSHPDAALP